MQSSSSSHAGVLEAGGSPARVIAPELRTTVVAAGVVTAIYFWLFFDFFRSQVIRAVTEQADWGHTLVIPFIAGYLVYLNRVKLLAKPFKTAWEALIPMVLGVALYITSTMGPPTLNHYNIQGFAVWLTLAGLTLLFFGWRSMRWLWFPLLYVLVFGQTISERFLNIVTFPMQDIAARGAGFLLSLGLDVDREGNTLYIFDDGEKKPLNIAQACSGMRMLMAFLALGVFMAYTGLKRVWQQMVLVVMAVPTAIFVNILRVVTLGILVLFDNEFAAGEFHNFVGLVWLLPAFFIYLGIMWIVRNIVVEQEHAVAGASARRA